MREPVAMPLFEGGPGRRKHDTPNQATLAEQKFRSTPETFQNTQESSGNIPEKTDKEKKIKEKQNKENSSSTPRSLPERLRRRKREFYFLLPYWVRTVAPNGYRQASTATGGCEGGGRETAQSAGLINTLRPYNLSQRELEEVLQLSRHGEIGNPVWSILAEMHETNVSKCRVYSC